MNFGGEGFETLELGGFEKGIIVALNGIDRISMLFEELL
jgi:hypothetical protein